MIKIILLFILSINLYAVCDSPISRTNNSANSKLTSIKYNTDLNTVYTAANAVDGSCITDSTITAAKLDTTGLAPVVTTPKEGCKVSYSNVSTLSIGKCRMAIGGNMVTTTVANTVAFGCSGCSVESASSSYYVYAKSDSTGTTLNLLILSATPNEDGYDSSGNRVLGRFYNGGGSDIDRYSIDQWVVNKFSPTDSGWVAFTPTSSWATNTTWTGKFRRQGSIMEIAAYASFSGVMNDGVFTFTIPNGSNYDTDSMPNTSYPPPIGQFRDTDAGSGEYAFGWVYYGTTSLLYAWSLEYGSASNHNMAVLNSGTFLTINGNDNFSFRMRVPISGWND